MLNVLYNVLTDFDIGKIEVLLTDIVVARELDISGIMVEIVSVIITHQLFQPLYQLSIAQLSRPLPLLV